MQQEIPVARIVRFGSFEVDLKENRMTKSGLRIRLQAQPFQILALLLEKAGDVVSREEIRQELWSDETFVEFDDALNTAVGKLRAALSDPADNPRFVETVHRRGYRFIAPVSFPAESQSRRQPYQNDRRAIQSSHPNDFPESRIVPVQPLANELLVAVNSSKSSSILLPLSIAAACLFVFAGGFAIYRHHPSHPFQVSAQDTIIVADFINTTGEPVFDDALRQALEMGLQQSPSVKVLPDRKTSVILKQMGRSPEERITGKIAVEVCQRAGGKVEVQGSIHSLGTAYLVGLATIQCDNGEPIANEQVQARRKEDVVDAVGQATAQLRQRLGESLPSIQKNNAPLEQATTASLDALNAYGLALSTWDKKGNRDSLPIFKRAIELDPNFAQAYSGLATIYHNLGESNLARENAAKAYELRSRVTQAERANIEARYYNYVTGELEKTAEVRTLEVQNFPDSPGAYNHLGNVDEALGRYEQSIQDYRKAISLDPTRAGTYSDLASNLLALNKVQDASDILKEAQRRNLQTDLLIELNYWIAFLHQDAATMQHLVQQSPATPGVQSLLLSEESDTEAFHGRLQKADALSRKAAALLEYGGDKESAALRLAQAAIREAETGNAPAALKLITEAQKLSRGRDVMILSALTEAHVGNIKQAAQLAGQLNADWPLGTYVQRYWLPVIRAQIDLRQHQPGKAIEDLSIALSPLEYACPPAMPVAALYPAYLRGQAYLAMGDSAKAIAEFQKLTAHQSMTVNYLLGPLAYLDIARSYAKAGDAAGSRKSYQAILELWKESDSQLPILKQAHKEFASLP